MDAPLVFNAAGLGHRYGRGTPTFAGIDLSLAATGRMAVLGPSGSGKSTLLRVLAGLEPASTGELGGQHRRMAMMFQRPMLFPWLNVTENLRTAARIAGVAVPDVTALLQLVGLDGLGDRRLAQLSGGQQQRVALARALATRPDVLLLDEPFSALDPVTRAQLRRDLGAIIRTTGLALVIVTHDPADALALADHALVLGGRPARVHATVGLRHDTAETDLLAALHAASQI